MSSAVYDDDVQFETEEETSEFEEEEEEEEETVKTVTVKLPNPAPKPSSETQNAVGARVAVPREMAAGDHGDGGLKKSSKINVSASVDKESKVVENGREDLNSFERESHLGTNEGKEFEEEPMTSRKNKDKSKSEEKKKSKEESKRMMMDGAVAEEGLVEVDSKKSSKNKKEKSVYQEEVILSSKKKYGDDEGHKSAKKDKHERACLDGEAGGELKEKSKKKSKRHAPENDGGSLEDPSPSPSSSSSDLEKLKFDKSLELKIKEETVTLNREEEEPDLSASKASKKKSKKSGVTSVESSVTRMPEDSKLDAGPRDTVGSMTSASDTAETTATTTTTTISSVERTKVVEEKVEQAFEGKQEDVARNKLFVDDPRIEREENSPENSASPTIAGRIEQTRNYLKALTPDRSAGDDEKSIPQKSSAFDTRRQDDVDNELSSIDKDGKEHVWDPKPESKNGDGKVLENEESDFTYRRKSMDEFIKKILAEAREEDQKLKESQSKMASSYSSFNSKPLVVVEPADDVDDDDFEKRTFKKLASPEIQVTAVDVDKELEEINKYFAKHQETFDGNLSSEKPSKHRHDMDPSLNENGYLPREHKRHDDYEHDETGGSILKMKTTTSNYIDLQDDDHLTTKKQRQVISTPPVKKTPRTALMNGDAFGKDDDAEETTDISDFLAKFKRERQALFGGPGAGRLEPEPKRCVETEELVRDRTRNMKSVIDQQLDICQNVKAVSKQLDDLEKELREVRQISLDRRGRMEALENSVNSEYKMYELEQKAALDRIKDKKPLQKFTQEVKDQMIANIQLQQAARSKKNERYRGDLLSDDVSSSLKRRVGSVSSQAGLLDEQDNFFLSSSPVSTSPYHSLAPSRGRGTSSDRDSYLASFLTVDRRREGSGGGSRSRLSFIDGGSDFDDLTTTASHQPTLFSKPKSRASIATMDVSSSISADDFLAKMRSKYSFLNPNQTGEDLSTTSNRFSRTSGNTGYRPLSSTTGGHESYRSRLEDPSSSSYLTVKSISGRGPSPTSYDLPGNRYSLASGAGRYSGIGGMSHVLPTTSYDGTRSRRATSVSDIRSSVHYDRHLGGYTTTNPSTYSGSHGGSSARISLGSPHYSHQPSYSSSTSSGGEFKSRFLDKVREKRSSSSGSSSHDLADRVKARLSGSKSRGSYDLPPPPPSTVQTGGTQVSITVESSSEGK